MNMDFYELFAASLQDGYVGTLIDIVDSAGGERALYMMSDDSLKKMGLSARMIRHINNRRNDFDYDTVTGIMEREKIKFIRYRDEEYPERLTNIPSKPYALFVKGEIPENEIHSVAIVGARNCSEYGRLMAEYFGNRLAKAGINIISGMAYGIDGIAQMAALDAGGRSFAVLGCGPDIAYPAGNRTLYGRLTKEGAGGVMSEYIPGSSAISRNFPPRNRIISGLSDIVLVIEARAKSGTLITVDMANEQGREIFALPGRVTDPLSAGCLNLIKYGASPAVCADDIICELENSFGYLCRKNRDAANPESNPAGPSGNPGKCSMKYKEKSKEKSKVTTPERNTVNPIDISDEESTVLSVLDYYPMNAERAALKSGIDITGVMVALTKLEIKGLVKCVSQGCFVKIT